MVIDSLFQKWSQLLMNSGAIRVMKVDQNALVFGLHSTSGDQPSDPSDESQPKCKKRPLSH